MIIDHYYKCMILRATSCYEIYFYWCHRTNRSNFTHKLAFRWVNVHFRFSAMLVWMAVMLPHVLQFFATLRFHRDIPLNLRSLLPRWSNSEYVNLWKWSVSWRTCDWEETPIASSHWRNDQHKLNLFVVRRILHDKRRTISTQRGYLRLTWILHSLNDQQKLLHKKWRHCNKEPFKGPKWTRQIARHPRWDMSFLWSSSTESC